MKQEYLEQLNQLTTNYDVLDKPFKWDHNLLRHLIALTYTMLDKEIDIDQIKSMKKYIKKTTSIFSPYKGMLNFTIAGLLSAQYDQPEKAFDIMLERESIIKKAGFKQSTYIGMANYALLRTLESEKGLEEQLEKAVSLYKDMKKNHPFLTSGDDYALSVLLSAAGHSVEELETYYVALNQIGFSKSNGLQTLSHIVTFSELDSRDMVDRCGILYDKMKENKLKVTTEFYPAIGLIALLEGDLNALAEDFVEVAVALKSQKKYKWLGKGMNILLASALISSYYIREANSNTMVTTTVSVSIDAIIAAQTAAMIAAITASSAAASSAAT